MPKLPTRIVAVLLVSCLLMNGGTAGAFVQPFGAGLNMESARPRRMTVVIIEQALAGRAIDFIGSLAGDSAKVLATQLLIPGVGAFDRSRTLDLNDPPPGPEFSGPEFTEQHQNAAPNVLPERVVYSRRVWILMMLSMIPGLAAAFGQENLSNEEVRKWVDRLIGPDADQREKAFHALLRLGEFASLRVAYGLVWLGLSDPNHDWRVRARRLLIQWISSGATRGLFRDIVNLAVQSGLDGGRGKEDEKSVLIVDGALRVALRTSPAWGKAEMRHNVKPVYTDDEVNFVGSVIDFAYRSENFPDSKKPQKAIDLEDAWKNLAAKARRFQAEHLQDKIDQAGPHRDLLAMINRLAQLVLDSSAHRPIQNRFQEQMNDIIDQVEADAPALPARPMEAGFIYGAAAHAQNPAQAKRVEAPAAREAPLSEFPALPEFGPGSGRLLDSPQRLDRTGGPLSPARLDPALSSAEAGRENASRVIFLHESLDQSDVIHGIVHDAFIRLGEFAYTQTPAEWAWSMIDHLIAQGLLGMHTKVADLGAGTGFVAHMIQAMAGADVTAFELDADLFRYGQRSTVYLDQLGAINASRIHWVQGDYGAMDLSGFDAIYVWPPGHALSALVSAIKALRAGALVWSPVKLLAMNPSLAPYLKIEREVDVSERPAGNWYRRIPPVDSPWAADSGEHAPAAPQQTTYTPNTTDAERLWVFARRWVQDHPGQSILGSLHDLKMDLELSLSLGHIARVLAKAGIPPRVKGDRRGVMREDIREFDGLARKWSEEHGGEPAPAPLEIWGPLTVSVSAKSRIARRYGIPMQNKRGRPSKRKTLSTEDHQQAQLREAARHLRQELGFNEEAWSILMGIAAALGMGAWSLGPLGFSFLSHAAIASVISAVASTLLIATTKFLKIEKPSAPAEPESTFDTDIARDYVEANLRAAHADWTPEQISRERRKRVPVLEQAVMVIMAAWGLLVGMFYLGAPYPLLMPWALPLATGAVYGFLHKTGFTRRQRIVRAIIGAAVMAIYEQGGLFLAIAPVFVTLGMIQWNLDLSDRLARFGITRARVGTALAVLAALPRSLDFIHEAGHALVNVLFGGSFAIGFDVPIGHVGMETLIAHLKTNPWLLFSADPTEVTPLNTSELNRLGRLLGHQAVIGWISVAGGWLAAAVATGLLIHALRVYLNYRNSRAAVRTPRRDLAAMLSFAAVASLALLAFLKELSYALMFDEGDWTGVGKAWNLPRSAVGAIFMTAPTTAVVIRVLWNRIWPNVHRASDWGAVVKRWASPPVILSLLVPIIAVVLSICRVITDDRASGLLLAPWSGTFEILGIASFLLAGLTLDEAIRSPAKRGILPGLSGFILTSISALMLATRYEFTWLQIVSLSGWNGLMGSMHQILQSSTILLARQNWPVAGLLLGVFLAALGSVRSLRGSLPGSRHPLGWVALLATFMLGSAIAPVWPLSSANPGAIGVHLHAQGWQLQFDIDTARIPHGYSLTLGLQDEKGKLETNGTIIGGEMSSVALGGEFRTTRTSEGNPWMHGTLGSGHFKPTHYVVYLESYGTHLQVPVQRGILGPENAHHMTKEGLTVYWEGNIDPQKISRLLEETAPLNRLLPPAQRIMAICFRAPVPGTPPGAVPSDWTEDREDRVLTGSARLFQAQDPSRAVYSVFGEAFAWTLLHLPGVRSHDDQLRPLMDALISFSDTSFKDGPLIESLFDVSTYARGGSREKAEDLFGPSFWMRLASEGPTVLRYFTNDFIGRVDALSPTSRDKAIRLARILVALLGGRGESFFDDKLLDFLGIHHPTAGSQQGLNGASVPRLMRLSA